jgi:outer membrane protein assembly factor BamB
MRIICAVVCLAASLFGATRHKAAPEHAPGGMGLSSTRPSGHRPRQIVPQVLPDGRMVVVADDTAYMLNADGRRIWKYAIGDESDDPSIYAGEAIWRVVYSAVRNELLLDCDDNLTILLDAETGAVRYSHQPNGASLDAILGAYRNGYLGQTSRAGYGQHEPDVLFYVEIDTSSKQENTIWSFEVPAGAEIFANGDRLYLVKRIYSKATHALSIRLQELHPPAAANKIGGEGLK